MLEFRLKGPFSYKKDLELGLAFDHVLILSYSIHCTVLTHMHATVIIPLSQASEQADTHAIAIIDTKLNLARPVEI